MVFTETLGDHPSTSDQVTTLTMPIEIGDDSTDGTAGTVGMLLQIGTAGIDGTVGTVGTIGIVGTTVGTVDGEIHMLTTASTTLHLDTRIFTEEDGTPGFMATLTAHREDSSIPIITRTTTTMLEVRQAVTTDLDVAVLPEALLTELL